VANLDVSSSNLDDVGKFLCLGIQRAVEFPHSRQQAVTDAQRHGYVHRRRKCVVCTLHNSHGTVPFVTPHGTVPFVTVHSNQLAMTQHSAIYHIHNGHKPYHA